MVCWAWLGVQPALARELLVGPTQALRQPSQAAAIAQNGDIVRIDPGTYADCAVWSASHLTIEAAAPGVRIAGKSCGGIGIFVILGDDTTINGITFADAKVAEGNGAGIKVTGDNLTVTDSQFLHNQNGILAGGSVDSTVRITGSTFIGNGACIKSCAHGVYAGAPIRLLDIRHCLFLNTRTAHHIKSRAQTTIIWDSRIEDGPEGTSSYLIETPNGGNLILQDNVLEKGANSSNPATAISIGAEGVTNWTGMLVIRNNRFRNDLPLQTIFVRNLSETPARLVGNTVSGMVELLEGPRRVDRPE
jgi:hypothetical protein